MDLDPNDLRPIMKMMLFGKLVDSWLFHHEEVRAFLRIYIPDIQMAFERGGTELMAHALRIAMAHMFAKKSGYILSLDFINCFNRIKWEAIIDLCDRCPLLKRYIRLIYGTGEQQVTYVCIFTGESFTIPNQEGGGQGMPSTALLCAALLGPIQELLQKVFTSDLDLNTIAMIIFGFMDDTTLIHENYETVVRAA
jgi:hypothetical protein